MKKYLLLLFVSILSYESAIFALPKGVERRHERRVDRREDRQTIRKERRQLRKERHQKNHSFIFSNTDTHA